MTEDYLQRFGERRAQDGLSRRAVANGASLLCVLK